MVARQSRRLCPRALAHDGLLVLTWDEDDASAESNQIPTTFFGAHIVPGEYAEAVDHFRVLATLEAMFGLTPLGSAANRTPIEDVWDDLFANGFDGAAG